MKKFKKYFKIIALVLVGAVLGGALVSLTDVADNFKQERNEKNLIVVDETYVEDGTSDNGVNWKVSEDGTIKLYGEAGKAETIKVQTVSLDAGTYTYSVGQDKVNKSKFYSYVSANGEQYIAGTDSATFELAEEANVEIYICWYDDVEFGDVIGTTFRPVLVKGENAGEFYSK